MTGVLGRAGDDLDRALDRHVPVVLERDRVLAFARARAARPSGVDADLLAVDEDARPRLRVDAHVAALRFASSTAGARRRAERRDVDEPEEQQQHAER